jgi:chromosome segregation ATPase
VLKQRQVANQTEQELVIEKHDDLKQQYETNDRIRALEAEIDQTQSKIDSYKCEIDGHEKLIAESQKFKTGGHAKCKKMEQDFELNLKKIEKSKAHEKELQDQIEKRTEELRVIAVNLKKLEQGGEVED